MWQPTESGDGEKGSQRSNAHGESVRVIQYRTWWLEYRDTDDRVHCYIGRPPRRHGRHWYASPGTVPVFITNPGTVPANLEQSQVLFRVFLHTSRCTDCTVLYVAHFGVCPALGDAMISKLTSWVNARTKHQRSSSYTWFTSITTKVLEKLSELGLNAPKMENKARFCDSIF